MEAITSSVTKISFQTIKRLFPHLSDKSVHKMMRGDVVDFLIGMMHPSWHPDQAEKAKGGGDFWAWRGQFGECISGRHPKVKEEIRKSKNLFVEVSQVHHITTSLLQDPSSHELDFCPMRAAKSVSYTQLTLPTKA